MSVQTSWLDTFIRANQAGLGTDSSGQAWAQVAGTDTLAIASNQGTITNNASGAANRMLLGPDSMQNAQVSARFTSGTSIGDTLGLILRSDALAANHYVLRSTPNVANQIQIDKRIAGAVTNLLVITLGSNVIVASSAWWLRFEASGTTLLAKAWADGQPEPTAWSGSIVDASFSTGQYGIYASGAPVSTEKFDHFSGNIITPLQTHQGQHRAFARVQ